MQQVAASMKVTKRNTIDVSPKMKERIRKIAKQNQLGVTASVEVILERALPDFESGKAKITTVIVEDVTNDLAQ